MKKKLFKITKIFLVLTLIFSELSGVTTVLADEIMDNGNVEEETMVLVANGYLKDESSTSLDGAITQGVTNYAINTAGKYTQMLTISDVSGTYIEEDKEYMVKVNDGEEVKYSGNDLTTTIFEGTVTDLTNSFNTIVNYTDVIVITEVENEENTITLEYKAIITYNEEGNDFALTLNTLYEGYSFEEGMLIVNARNLPLSPEVPSVKYLFSMLNENNGITLEITDRDGNVVELEEETITEEGVETLEETTEEVEEVLVKNGYTLKFTKGLSEKTYVVLVMGDITGDSIFDKNDMLPTMEGYLANKNIPSMDLYTPVYEEETPSEEEEPVLGEEEETTLEGNTEEVEEPKEEIEKEEFGTITFEDIMTINGYLNETEERDNTDLSLEVSADKDELYVGDTFKVDVTVKSSDVEDFINGITGLVSNSDNVKLLSITFNEKLIGTYNEDNMFVAAGTSLSNDEVVMSLEFMAIDDGEASIGLTGKVANGMNIKDLEELTCSVNIMRKSSNSNLSSLKADIGTFDIEFDKDVTAYTLTVPSDAKEVILSGALEDLLSSVDGLYKYELTEDKTTAIITVTAEDGSTKVYTVYIIKEKPVVTTPVVYYYSSNNYLKLLEVSGYELEFDKNKEEYTLSVKNDVTSLDITAIAEDSRARVEITGNEKFKVGKNTIVISVKAENGDVREYKLVVTKEDDKSTTLSEEESSNTAEKVVIIILIVLVVLGLLYLIFKKDEEEVNLKPNEEKKNDNSKKNKNTSRK